jgi:hypothetical protein
MTDMTVANEIARQIGGKAFYMMGSKKTLTAGDDNLCFKVMRNGEKVTHVRVTLNAADTYDVEFIRCWGTKAPKTLKTVEGVYCDMLREVISSGTGLALVMPNIVFG